MEKLRNYCAIAAISLMLSGCANQSRETEYTPLIKQLSRCWQGDVSGPVVYVSLQMNRDGTVKSRKVTDAGRYKTDPAYHAAADDVLRAIDNPRCKRLYLPDDQYNSWKSMTVRFDPASR